MVTAAVCLMGVAVVSLGDTLERAAILFVAGAAWTTLGAYHRTQNASPIGAWAVIIGAAWLLGRLDEAGNRTLFTVGNVIGMIDVPPTVLVLLAFPLGRLSLSSAAIDHGTGLIDAARVRRLRMLVYATCAWTVLLQLWVLFDPRPNSGCTGCVGRNYRVADLPALSISIQVVRAVSMAVIGALVVAAFERAFRSRDSLHRSAHVPVRVGVWIMAVSFAALLVAAAVGPPQLARGASLLATMSFLLLPFLYGFGLYRWAELESDVLATLEGSTACGREAVAQTLRSVLRDPALTLSPADAAITRSAEPGRDPRRTVLETSDGTVVGIVTHAPRMPDTDLLDRALGWAARRLAPPGGPDSDADVEAWRPRLASLTDAELATALRLCAQRTNKQIADELVLAVGSVNNRVSRIYQKLEVEGLSRRERAAVIARLGSAMTSESRQRADVEDR